METNLTKLKRRIVFRLILFSIIVFLFLFVPAGSLAFWEAWIYYFIFLGSSIFITIFFYKRDPELIERRMRRKETLKEQKLILRKLPLLLPMLPMTEKCFLIRIMQIFMWKAMFQMKVLSNQSLSMGCLQAIC